MILSLLSNCTEPNRSAVLSSCSYITSCTLSSVTSILSKSSVMSMSENDSGSETYDVMSISDNSSGLFTFETVSSVFCGSSPAFCLFMYKPAEIKHVAPAKKHKNTTIFFTIFIDSPSLCLIFRSVLTLLQGQPSRYYCLKHFFVLQEDYRSFLIYLICHRLLLPPSVHLQMNPSLN